MFSLKFNKVEDEQPVAWKNIKTLSKLHNLQLTICAIIIGLMKIQAKLIPI